MHASLSTRHAALAHPIARRYNLAWLTYPERGGVRDLVSGGVGAWMTGGALAGGDRIASSSVSNGGVQFPFPAHLTSIAKDWTLLWYGAFTTLDFYSALLTIPKNSGWTYPYIALGMRRVSTTSQLELAWYDGGDLRSTQSSSGVLVAGEPETLYAITYNGATASFYKGIDTAGANGYAQNAISWGSPPNITLFNRHKDDPGEGTAGVLRMAAIFPSVLPVGVIRALARDPELLIDRYYMPLYAPSSPPPPPPPPVASEAAFSASPTSGVAPLEVDFTDESTGDVEDWDWDIDNDGAVDYTTQHPTHTYADPGTYSVKLTVTGPGGSDSETKLDYVTVSASPPPPPPPPTPVAGAIAYTVELDFERAGDFGHDLADVTDRVKALRWNVGMNEAYQTFAPPSRLELTLDNSDGAFSPDAAAASYYGLLVNGVLARVQATYDETTYTLWQGKVASVGVAPGQLTNDAGGWQEARLVAEDPLPRLLDADYVPALRQNVRVDSALIVPFDLPIVPYPYDRSYWIIDYSPLGEGALYENVLTAFEQAQTTLRWVGDNLDKGSGINPQVYLRELVAAEAGGRFWWDARNAVFRFHNRHHDALADLSGTFSDDDLTGAAAAFGEDVANVVTVAYEPRLIGSPATILWSTGSFTLRVGASRVFTARYSDGANADARVGAVEVIPPVPGVDYTVAGDVRVTIEVGAASSRITVINLGAVTATVNSLQLRGTPLISYKRDQVTMLDAVSIGAYDRREHLVSLPAVDDDEFAADVARATLARFKTAFSRWRSASFLANGSETLISAALERTVGERVRLQDAWSDHDAEYVIVGERHQVDARTRDHRVTWILKPRDRERWFILADADEGELDGDNVIAL